MPENKHTEYKSSFSDAVIETLVAFANTKGGSVWIGMDDNGKPINGFSIGKETMAAWINEIKNKTQPSLFPDIEALELGGQTVVKIFMPEFPIKPVAFKGRYFKRLENSNHQLDLAEIAALHLKSFNSSWDNYASIDHSIESISLDKVNRFIEQSNKLKDNPVQDDPLTVLYKFELLRNTDISNACHLLFANAEVFLSTIELGRFSAPTLIKDGLTLRADLFTEVEEVLSFIRKHINKEFIISGQLQREERWQYPLNALREIIVNMIVHRDYTHYGDSSIKIYDDHIEFFNPGGLPEAISIEQLMQGNYTSQARNRKIAAMFKEAGLIEKYGSGIQRIQNNFLQYGLNVPAFENFQHGFKVTVFAKLPEEVVEEVNGGVNGGVNDETAALITFIKNNPGVNSSGIKPHFNIPQRTLERLLKSLKDTNQIEFSGPAKKGGYHAK